MYLHRYKLGLEKGLDGRICENRILSKTYIHIASNNNHFTKVLELESIFRDLQTANKL